MAQQKTGHRPKESNTIVGVPKPGGAQAEKSKGKGDDSINQSHESGRKPSEVGAPKTAQPTQDPPDDGGFTDGRPKDRV